MSDELSARLQAVEKTAEASSKEVIANEEDAREAATSRRFVTRIVLLVWATSLIAYVVATALTRPQELSAGLVELIKTAILPLTTLVLGYYLSRSK
ncbi:MAG: hypothetical protein ACOYOH_11460 [Paracraurococcus sp.]